MPSTNTVLADRGGMGRGRGRRRGGGRGEGGEREWERKWEREREGERLLYCSNFIYSILNHLYW